MIQDVFKLKKDSWHMKLMHRIWGYNYYDFPNMCPYFWLSVLNVIIAPLFFLGVILIPVFIKLGDLIEMFAEKRKISCYEQEKKWIEEMKIRIKNTPNDPVVVSLAREYNKYYTSAYKANSRKRWFFINSHLFPELEQKAEEIKTQEREKRLAKKTKRAEIGQYTVKIKYAAKIAGIAILLFGGYWLVKLILFLTTLNWAIILLKAVKGLGIIVGVFILAVIIILIIRGIDEGIKKLWCKYGEMCIPCYERREKVRDFFVAILKGTALPFIWIFKGGKQLFYILKALKDNNCPAIEWEE